MVDVVYYLFNSLGTSSQPRRLILVKWLKVSEKRFNEILSIVTKAKNNGFKTSAGGKKITLDRAESLLKDLGNGLINRCEFKKKYNKIVDDVKNILETTKLTRSQNKILKVLSLLKEINDGSLYEKSDIVEQESDEQLDTTDMSELESEESAEQNEKQRGVRLKILTPEQILSRLSITLAQLKAENNSKKLINEIR